MPPVAVAGVLRCIVGSETRTLAENLAEERRAVMRTQKTKDLAEGMMAFLEKRKPKFTGE
jgi:enoyl-CoA hydratase/carnithine racemase